MDRPVNDPTAVESAAPPSESDGVPASVPSDRPSNRLTPIVVAAVIAVISGGMVWNAMTAFGSEARRVPLVVGVPLLIFALLNLAREIRDAFREDEVVEDEVGSRDWLARLDAEVGVDSESVEDVEDVREGAISLWRASGVIAVATVMFLFLGQMLMAPVFIVWQMRFVTKQSWGKTLITGVLTFALMYVLIAVLEMPSYDGWIAERTPWLMEVIHP